MSTAFQPGIVELLEQAGAHPRGNRHDCPKCGEFRTVTHTAECFYCHHCQWKGNSVTLAKELGVFQRLATAEYRELRKRREQADHAARELYARVKARRFELLDQLHDLNRLESVAHDSGPTEAAWDALAVCYRQCEPILAELTILENSGAADVIRFLNAESDTRQSVIDAVISRGGLFDSSGGFIEVNP